MFVTLYQLKPAFQNLLRPLVGRLAEWHISPNQVTVSAILLSGAMGVASACFPQSQTILLLLPFILLGRMALNAIDGMLAREYSLTSPLGCILNELGDVISDVVLYLPFSLIPGMAAPWIVIVVILAIVAEMTGVLGLAIAQKRQYQGPMGKSDRAFVFAIVGLYLGLGFEPQPWLTGIWMGIVVLQLWTIFNRIRATLQEVTPCR